MLLRGRDQETLLTKHLKDGADFVKSVPQHLSRIQIGMMSNMFNYVVSEEHSEILEGCLYSLRGFKS